MIINIKKISNVYFHNNFHNGDVHLSKGFIKAYQKIIGHKNFYYIHNCNKKITADLEPDIKTVNANIQNLQDKLIYCENENLFINTWIGTENKKYLNTYGLNFNSNKIIFNEVLQMLNLQSSYTDEELLPNINFSAYNLRLNNVESIKSSKNILFCNNDFKSGQSYNFDTDYFLQKLVNKYKEYNFIVTNYTNIKSNNIIPINDLVDNKDFNLLECSYISLYCDHIIGRSSGPYTVSLIRDNLLNGKKNFYCLANAKDLVCWYENSLCKKKWYNSVEDFINLELNI